MIPLMIQVGEEILLNNFQSDIIFILIAVFRIKQSQFLDGMCVVLEKLNK